MKKAESDVEKKKSELRKLELEEKEISRRLLKVQSRPSDDNMCRNCHLRLGHTARNCSYANACPFLIAVRRNYIQENSTTEGSELPLIS